jgi:hypothetical protein
MTVTISRWSAVTFEEWVKLILQSNLLTAIIVGFFGLLTLWLGLRKFRSEKWWERKAAAYASAIEALHGMHDLANARMEAEEMREDLPAERLSSLLAVSQAGLSEIRKGANIGSFIMSKRSAMILKDVLNDFDKMQAPTSYEFYDTRAAILSGAITQLTAEAKRDLRT